MQNRLQQHNPTAHLNEGRVGIVTHKPAKHITLTPNPNPHALLTFFPPYPISVPSLLPKYRYRVSMEMSTGNLAPNRNKETTASSSSTNDDPSDVYSQA